MEPTSPRPTRLRRLLEHLVSWEGLSALVTITSLALVATQTMDLRRSVQRDTYQKAYQTVFDLDRLFLDHPELKPYFYSGQTLDAKTDPVLRARVESTAEWISDFFDNLFYNVKLGPNEDWSAWESYIEETFRRSPALRDYVQAHRGWYSDELGEALDRVSAAK
jgi:hypothetical protein